MVLCKIETGNVNLSLRRDGQSSWSKTATELVEDACVVHARTVAHDAQHTIVQCLRNVKHILVQTQCKAARVSKLSANNWLQHRN